MRNKVTFIGIGTLLSALLLISFIHGVDSTIDKIIPVEAADKSNCLYWDSCIYSSDAASITDSQISNAVDTCSQSTGPCVTHSLDGCPDVPNDKYYYRQKSIVKPPAIDLWQNTRDNPNVLVAVVDSGIDYQHEDLTGKVVANANFSSSPTYLDTYGHGTHIAGTIGAISNNYIGITGIAPNARLVNVKVTESSGEVSPDMIASAIVYAVDTGSRVINMSFSFKEAIPIMEDAVNYAWNKGAVLICSAGNDTGVDPVYPAYFDNCIAVTTHDIARHIVETEDYINWIDVSAPGTGIYSTLPGNSYGYKSGTSMSTAYVSGIAALLFSMTEDANSSGFINDEVRYIIENSCEEMGIIHMDKVASSTKTFRQSYI